MYIFENEEYKYIRDRKIYLYIGTGWESFSWAHFTPFVKATTNRPWKDRKI